MPWLQIWFVLVTLALTVLTLVGLRLWRQAKALVTAFGEVTSQMGELSAGLDRLGAAGDGADSFSAYDRH